MNDGILIVAVILCLAVSIIYKRWANSYALRKLYELRKSEDSEQFIQAVDSSFIRLQFSEFTRTFMKLNYWIYRDEEAEVEALAPAFDSVRSTPQDKAALDFAMFEYTLLKHRYDRALAYREKLEGLLKDRTDKKSAFVKEEVERLSRLHLAGY